MAEHPTDVHEYVLKDHSDRITELEAAMQEVQNWKSANDERMKSLTVMLTELKEMLAQYTKDMREAMNSLSAKMEARFIVIDKELADVKNKPGRTAASYVEKVFTFALAAVVGYLMSQVFKGTP